MKLSRKDKKEGIIVFIAFVLSLILMHGNELGEFHNTNKANVLLEPVLYVACLIPLLLFFRKGFSMLSIKLKILKVIYCMVLALAPMFLLTGLGNYIDYYTTNKEWKLENVTIIGKSSKGNGRGSTIYSYTVRIKDSTILLYSKLNCPVEEVLHLKIWKTNMGMIVAEKYYE